MLQRFRREIATVVPALVVALHLTACGIDNDNDNGNEPGEGANVAPSAATVISGSVGDGPITGATLSIYDRDGNLVQTEVSDNSANYSARIKAKGNAYPLTIQVDGGIDLVTGREPDFRLRSVIMHPSVKRVNINPFSTLIVESAQAMPGGLSQDNLDNGRQRLMQQLNFGLDPASIADPIATAITNDNVAVMVKASEALGEMIRRTADRLQAAGIAASPDQVVAALGDDLVDGVVDGQGGADADSRTSALATLNSAQVLIETLSNNLHVDNTVATLALDGAIRTTHPSVPDSGLTASVRINAQMLDQVRLAVAAAQALAPSIELSSVASVLADIPVNSLPGQVEALLPGDTGIDLEPAIAMASSGSEQELEVVNEVVRLGTVPDDTVTANQPPQISGTPASSVVADNLYLFQPSASDADGNALEFSIVNPPVWASFDPGTGRLSGTPESSQGGSYSGVTISVSDGSASDSIGPFSITVTVPNTAPTISGTAPVSVAVGTSYSFQPSAGDADGDILEFSIANRPSWALFDTSTGRLSGTPGSADAGVYNGITISVSDGLESSNLPAFALSVNAPVPDNSAPSISGTPSTSIAEDSAYVFVPGASDADGDSLSFGISNRPSWASFNSTTGRLAGIPDNSHVGTYQNIIISVSDGKAVAALGPFSIQVINSNDAPSISGNPATSVAADSAYSFQPLASDPDGDNLTFSIQNRPAWASFNSSTGQLSGTPAAGDVGSYSNVLISVSDGKLSTALPAFSLSVNSAAAQTGSVSLAWAAPATRSDGAPLPLSEIAGYTLYYGSSLGNYSSTLDIDDPISTSVTVTDLPLGTYYFVLTTRDTDGRESDQSSPAQRQVQ